MIRIKNISRENIGVRRQNTGVRLPSGRIAQVRQGKEIVIDLATYKLNRLIIALPNEPMGKNTYYRVISGAEEILGKVAPPVVREPIELVKAIEPEVIETTPPEPPEPEMPVEIVPESENEAPMEEEAITPEPPEIIPEEEPKVEEVEQEGSTEPEPIERTPLYTQSKLGKMVHAQLDELLTKHGITMPEGTLKSEKIDALLKLNG